MSSYNPERRAVLRSIFIAACAFCAPVAWGAETSTGKSQKPAETKKEKVSKSQAKYQEKPKGDQKCDNCINFIAPSSCKLVEGKISADGWCMLWAKK